MNRPGQSIRVALVGAICLSAATASAQPGASAPPPPPPPDDPYGAPSPEPPPPPDQPPPPPDQPYSQPPPYGQPPPPPPPPYAQPPQQQPPGIQRAGWFIGFSLGVGSITLTDDEISSDSYGGAQFGLRFGGMVNPRFGLMLDLGGGVYSIDENAGISLAQSSIGVAGQYWVIPQLWLRVGIAASSIGTRRDGEKLGNDLDGMQISGAVGYEVWQGRRFAMDLSLNASAGRYDPDVEDVGTSQAGLSVGFNWY